MVQTTTEEQPVTPKEEEKLQTLDPNPPSDDDNNTNSNSTLFDVPTMNNNDLEKRDNSTATLSDSTRTTPSIPTDSASSVSTIPSTAEIPKKKTSSSSIFNRLYQVKPKTDSTVTSTKITKKEKRDQEDDKAEANNKNKNQHKSGGTSIFDRLSKPTNINTKNDTNNPDNKNTNNNNNNKNKNKNKNSNDKITNSNSTNLKTSDPSAILTPIRNEKDQEDLQTETTTEAPTEESIPISSEIKEEITTSEISSTIDSDPNTHGDIIPNSILTDKTNNSNDNDNNIPVDTTNDITIIDGLEDNNEIISSTDNSSSNRNTDTTHTFAQEDIQPEAAELIQKAEEDNIEEGGKGYLSIQMIYEFICSVSISFFSC